MLSLHQLKTIARARLKDAKALLTTGRNDGAAYLCGYAVEVALKSRITKTLKRKDFPEHRKEFEGLASFKTHNLEMLLKLSGAMDKIKTKFPKEWSAVTQWSPEQRYSPPGGVTAAAAKELIVSASTIVGVLL